MGPLRERDLGRGAGVGARLRIQLLLLALLGLCAFTAWRLRERFADPVDEDWVPDRPWYTRETPPSPPAHPRIEDRAGMLGPFVRSLGAYADGIRADLGIDVRVVTMVQRSESIDRQANDAFRTRSIGADAPNGGVLVLLNPTLVGARIEVSDGLDAVYTDAFVGRLVREQLTPFASYGVAGMAVLDALHGLKDRGFEAAVRRELEIGDDVRSRREYLDLEGIVAGGAGSKAAMPDQPFDADRKARVAEPQRSRYAPSADPGESVEAYLRASADHAGDPSLELFTEGSRIQRERYPVAEFEEMRLWRRAEESRPLEILREDEHAVATSSRRVTGFVPVLLHREAGLWRVDLVETWKNLFFDSSGNYVLHNANTPYAFGLESYGSAAWHDVGQLPLPSDGPGALARALAALEGQDSVVPHVRLGDLLFRNADLMLDAMREYEAALAIAPEDPLPLERLARIALYHGFAEAAVGPLLRLGPGFEVELADAYSRIGDLAGAERWSRRAVERDGYDARAIHALRFVAQAQGEEREARSLGQRLRELEDDPEAKSEPVRLEFFPPEPRIDTVRPLHRQGTTLFDHTSIGARMTNLSRRPVEIEYVLVQSRGDAEASGLGDVRDSWNWPSGKYRLGAGESATLDVVWGFTVDTRHTHVRYVFHVGWRDAGSGERQRRTQWVDAMP